MFKTEFLQKKCQNTPKLYDRFFFSDFSKQVSELPSFISACLKSIVTVELAAQNAGPV